MRKLRGEAASIADWGTGLGKSTANIVSGEGARIAIIDWFEKAGKEATSEMNKLGGEAYFIEAKMSEPDLMEKAIEEATQKLSALHILHNNLADSSARDGIATDLLIDE